ncbi:MAG: N-methyl-L-tryptophan oxidase [Chloroflexota bacterium]|nr:N-methyl-L-tryptophan oxidase [Chloroflexota bacterium]MDE2852747.1 N-methyl-L-tryptophan oxidase [Chloroflexota bacterium]MDE2946162.1 N-methyl-L-tryptophan oxidase [Chloroflexota bacterium]
MAQGYDVIVVGLGAMGAAALYQASKRGARALGIDRFQPPHTLGSSHGDTRITRAAIGEGEFYVPLVRRSDQIWRELESLSGRRLFEQSGGLIIAPPSASATFHGAGDFVEASARVAERHGIAHEVIGAEEIRRRHPLLKPRSIDRAYYEPGAGVLRPERCIQAQLDLARQAGATVQFGEKVTGYEAAADGLTVTSERGRYRADKLILSAGAWMADLLPGACRPALRVCRQVIYWFEAEDISQFDPRVFPWVIWIGESLDEFWSTFPAPPDGEAGVKLVTEQYHTATHPDAVKRAVAAEERADMFYRLTEPRLKGLRDNLIRAEVCLYTVTPDEHFLIDFHPESERVVIASPCSGHGFKHSAAVGETLAQMALDGESDFDISAFRLARLTKPV